MLCMYPHVSEKSERGPVQKGSYFLHMTGKTHLVGRRFCKKVPTFLTWHA